MAFVLGTTRRGKPLSLSSEERSRHVHIVGVSGTGKSKLMESMIRQDILAGRGLCLIDPHGTLADTIVAFCASRPAIQNARKIHVIEPANASWAFGFNPLRLDGITEPAARVDAMVNACAQVWGGEDTASTPLLKKCLRAVFFALAVRDLTLLESVELINSADPLATRRALTENLPDYVFNSLWQDFNKLSRREFAEQFSSTNNRLIEFLSSPLIRRIVGQREHALDLRQIMDNDEILIVNLALRGSVSDDNARLIGTLLTSELFLLAKARSETVAKRHPFYLYIDECYDYLTSNVERMLDETRKFGLHLVLAHQRLGQLRRRSEAIYNGVMAGGQTKIVFGGLDDEDADVMARHVFRDSFNLERPKHILDKSTVVDEVPYWLDSEGTTESESTTHTSTRGESASVGSGQSSGASESYRMTNGNSQLSDMGLSTNFSSSDSNTSAWSTSEATSYGRSVSTGRSQALKPVRKILPTAVYSLEEELHLAIVKLRKLPKASAIVKRMGKPAVFLRATEMKPILANTKMIQRFIDHVQTTSPYLSLFSIADAEIEARHATLLNVKSAPQTEDAEFWHPSP